MFPPGALVEDAGGVIALGLSFHGVPGQVLTSEVDAEGGLPVADGFMAGEGEVPAGTAIGFGETPLAIELVGRLEDPRCKLVLSHATDVDPEYLAELRACAQKWGVDMCVPIDRIDSVRGVGADGSKVYGLWDVYPHADFCTYPSLYEGFGNALIEAIYFDLPALVNRYTVYEADIGPLGFDFVEIDGQVTEQAVASVRELLQDPQRRQKAVDTNRRLAAEYFSYQVVRDRLQPLIESFG